MKAVVLVIRGLNAALLGCYGSEGVKTPTLDRLAAESVVFDQHYVDALDPTAARQARETGRYHFSAGSATAVPVHPSLLELLRQRGIEVVRLPSDQLPLQEALAQATRLLRRFAALEQGLLWIEGDPWSEEPLDLRDEDTDDEPAEPLDEEDQGDAVEKVDLEAEELLWLQETATAVGSQVDLQLAAFLDSVCYYCNAAELLLIVTSDRGRPLTGAGGLPGTRAGLHEESVHLPLLLALPGQAEAGRRVAALTQPVDLLPTLLDAFGIALPELTHGRSLLPLAQGAMKEVRPYVCMEQTTDRLMERSLRSPDWYLLVARPAPEGPAGAGLFRKPEDRWEVNDLRQHHLELADRLEQTLERFVEASLRPGPLETPPLPEEVVASETPEGVEWMSTVKLVAENTDHPRVRAVFDDIKATKKIDRVPNIWRALATNPEHLELCWTRLKAIMQPGKVDLLTKEIIALAVSVTNGCTYCINSHTAAVQRLGLDNEALGEVLAVVGLYNQMNRLADAYQVDADIRPDVS